MRAIIFANGELSDAAGARALLRGDDVLIAADGGARLSQVLDAIPDVIIGDMDSLDSMEVQVFEEQGAKIVRFPPDKDETDLELAMLHAKELGASEVLVLGGLGRRWDQTAANLLLPAYEKLKDLKIVFWDAGQWLYVVRDELMIKGQAGMTVSLIPLGGDVVGVTTNGLAWELAGDRLAFGATRGVSNRMEGEEVSVEIKAGVLLVVVGSQDG